MFEFIRVGQHHLNLTAPETNSWRSFVEWYVKVFAQFKLFGPFTVPFGIDLAVRREPMIAGREGCLEVKGR